MSEDRPHAPTARAVPSSDCEVEAPSYRADASTSKSWIARLRGAFAADRPWLSLLYLAFYFFPWFFQAPTQLEIGVTAVVIPVFLVLYVRGFARGNVSGIAYAFAIAALGLAAIPFVAGAAVFLVYAGAMIGWTRPAKRALLVLGVLIVVVLPFAFVIRPSFAFWAPAIFITAMTGIACVMASTLKAGNEALRAAKAEAERLAAQAERERIGRDLHDLLGHTLTLVAVKADLAAKLIRSDPERAEAEIADIQATARSALHEVRLTVHDMKRASLSAEIARARAALAAADVTLETDAHLPAIPASLEQPIALLIRESVTNVVRHARASLCRIRLDRAERHVRLEISDDGRGGIAEGGGVAGMRDRVRALGGTFAVRSGPGATVEAVFPVEAEAAP